MHVFGYGSLVGLPGAALGAGGPVPARLTGFRRGWGVAMDNRRAIPGYKVYVDPATGERPPVHVAFLDVDDDPEGWLNGALLPVREDWLPALDRRERNYERRDVTERVDGAAAGPVWAYVGRAEARSRYRGAVAAGTAVISRDYLDRVRADFAALGAGELRDFELTTGPPPVPVRALRRVEVGGGGAPAAAEGVV